MGRLGWFDRVFVSPSNHRVHHGQNDYCIDRNYGGILIVWDRLFGTFVEERRDEPVVYGIRGALRSWNPVWANLQGYAAIAQGVAAAPRWADKLRLPFMPPGWVPRGGGQGQAKAGFDANRFERYAPPLPPVLAANALLQLAMLLAFGLHFLLVVPQISMALGAAYALAIGLQLTALTGLTTRARAGGAGEAARWLCGAVLLWASPLHGPAWLAAWLATGLLGAAALVHARQAAAQPAGIKAPGSPAG